MKYNFSKFVDIKEYKNQLKRKVQRTKSLHSSAGSSGRQYLDALADLFLEETKLLVKLSYENARIEVKKKFSKISECIQKGITIEFFPEYEQYMSDYNGGGVIRNYEGDLHRYKQSFIERARKELERECKLLENKDHAESRRSCRELCQIWLMVIGIIVTIVIAAIARN